MNKEEINVVSLFDGISCARVALEKNKTSVRSYYSFEIDKYAIQISQKNYPDIIHCGDVKDFRGIICEGDLKIDLLIGGSPCQDLSIAKKDRKGLDGERSGLFWEYVRILKEVKPKYFILENVNSMPKEAKAIITEALGVEPIMINASLVSAQNRKRLFWVGERIDTFECKNNGTDINGPITRGECFYRQVKIEQPEDRNILLKDILEPKVDDSFVVKPKSNTVRTSGRGSGIDDKHNWDTIRIGQIGKGGQGDRIYSPDGKSVGLSALGGGRGAKTGLYAVDNKSYCVPSTYYKENVKSLIKRKKTGLMVNEDTIIRKLTPIECERLQGLPDNYTEGVSNSQRYKCLGNAFNVDVVAWILSFIIK